MTKPELGRVMATRGVLQVMEHSEEDIWHYVDRHEAALRRKLSEIDVALLDPASQFLSTYKLSNGVPIGIVTESNGSGTTIFLIES